MDGSAYEEFMQEWIPLDEAAERLNVDLEELDRIISARQMRTSRTALGKPAVSLEDIEAYVELLAYDRAEAARSTKADETAARRPVKPVRTVETAHEMQPVGSLHGKALVTAADAAKRLRVTVRYVYTLIRSGRLAAVKARGRLRVLAEDVEAYARQQAEWAERGTRGEPTTDDGRQTTDDVRPTTKELRGVQAFGRSGVQGRETTDSGGSTTGAAVEEDMAREYWVTTAEAAEILAVTDSRVRTMTDEGKLTAMYSRRSPGRALKAAKTWHVKAWYRLSDVLTLAARREEQAWDRGITLKDWKNRPTEKPVIRTTLEPPPGDRFISTLEAAALLAVGRARVFALVERRRLFGWQKQAGRQGSKLWLSERQVLRYREERDRRAEERASRSPEQGMTNREMFIEWYGFQPEQLASRRPNVERDYGAFFTTPQVCRALGVSRGAVRSLRKRGRLKGIQRRRKPSEGVGGKWWFYRKDDVYALLADGEYRKWSAIGKRGGAASLKRREAG